MGAIPKSLINFDARTKIFLLIAVSAFIFTNANHIAETILLIFLLLLAILLGVPKTAVKGVAIYVGIMLLNNFVLPNMPEVIAANFNILFVTFRKLLPCFLMGAILIKTTSIRLLIYALQTTYAQSCYYPINDYCSLFSGSERRMERNIRCHEVTEC